MDSYTHRSLLYRNRIRILLLDPASSFNALLCCSLIEVDLDSEPCYEALSYAWGSAEGTCPLSCEGRALLITPNCESALRHLRLKRRKRRLWVDAICIDQKSTSERESQVEIMDEVFGKASQVLIWLGKSDKNTALTFGYLRTLHALYWEPFS